MIRAVCIAALPQFLLLSFLPSTGQDHAQQPLKEQAVQESTRQPFHEHTLQPGLIADVGPAGCFRSVLLQRPGWCTSGAWLQDGNTLLLADSLNRSLLTYTWEGRPLGPLTGTIGTAVADLSPSVLKFNESTNQLLVEVDDSDVARVLSLDMKLLPGTIHEAESSVYLPAQTRVAGLFQWQPVGNDLITFSDLQGPKETDWSSGIVRYPLGDPGHFTLLQHVPLSDSERVFFRLGFPYLTSVDNTAFVLTMGKTPTIYRDTNLDGTKVSDLGLKLVPTSLSEEDNPDLPPFVRPEDLVTVMAAVEHSSMPTGIFGWKHRLYVMSRFPEGASSGWALRSFDLAGNLLGTARIPSRASHLTAIPGSQFWAFVEKGPVKGYGVQDTKTILFVPSPLLEGMQPPMKLTQAASLCQDSP
jgi:hypothetical protein